MSESAYTVLMVSIVSLFLISLMTKIGWILWAIFFSLALRLIKWTIIIALVFGIMNMPQFYDCVGFTPISLLHDLLDKEPNAGAKFYKRVDDQSKKRQINQRRMNDRDKDSKVQKAVPLGRH
jgi:hypothetical protein